MMMMKKLFCAIFCLILINQTLSAQPANDNCGGAVTVPQTGCGSTVSGTTVGANDNWIGTVGCQSGNNDEVWYTFVATGTQAQITVTSGTMGGNVEITAVLSAAPPCGGLSIAGFSCGSSPRTLTISTTPGATYYYTISSTGADGTFTTCVLSSSPPPAAGFDCSSAAILCNDNQFSQSTSNSGFGTQEVNTSNSCWGAGGERQSKWFKFSVGCSGTLEFNINPVVSGDDYDFGLWNITGDPTGCTTKGNTIACNWSGCKGSTGITTCPDAVGEPGRVASGAGCGGNPAAWNIGTLNVTAGNVYALLVDNFSVSNSGFSLTFGGACGGGTAVIGPDASFTGVITDTPSPCRNLCVTKTCNISPSTNSTYLWNFGDGTTATTQNACHTYASNGLFTVSLTVTDLLGCVKTTSQVFNIGCAPLPVELVKFSGHRNNTTRLDELTWETESETNNDYFVIEFSEDALDYKSAGILAGNGNSNEFHSYHLTHDPQGKNLYYRLRQVDYDGNEKMYGPIFIDGAEMNFDEYLLEVYPNPAENVLSVKSNANGFVRYQITDQSGRVVKSSFVNGSFNEIDIQSLKAGIYFIGFELNGGRVNTKFIKK